MTTQGAPIKISLTLPDGLANASRLARQLSTAVAEWRQRRRDREAFRQWMIHEARLARHGPQRAGVDLSRRRPAPIELGLAFQMFHNRAGSERNRS